jgi:pSer/pThr/pTyr-binding forkhead associated (FHA) protein
MSVLRNIESKLESLFEGVFGRAFRANVQPVELARKLVKEMDEHRNVSVSRVYVPNEYTIYLSPEDREQFKDFEDSLREELQEYLAGHARREAYVLLSPPRVRLESDPDLDVGVFGIATRLAHTARKRPDEPPAEAEPGATMIYAAVQGDQADQAEEEPRAAPPPPPPPTIAFNGQSHDIAAPRVVLGRSKDADVHVPDPNVSRRHAELRQEGEAYVLIDLDSTNGIETGGRRVKRLKLENGTRFTLGSTEIVFSREPQ